MGYYKLTQGTPLHGQIGEKALVISQRKLIDFSGWGISDLFLFSLSVQF